MFKSSKLGLFPHVRIKGCWEESKVTFFKTHGILLQIFVEVGDDTPFGTWDWLIGAVGHIRFSKRGVGPSLFWGRFIYLLSYAVGGVGGCKATTPPL